MGEFPFPWRGKIHRCLKSRRIRGLNTRSEINKTRKHDKKERVGHRLSYRPSQRPARISDFCHEQKFQRSVAADICLKHCFRACESTSTGWALCTYPKDGDFLRRGNLKRLLSSLTSTSSFLTQGPSVYSGYMTLTIWPWVFFFHSAHEFSHPFIHPSLQLSKEKLRLGWGVSTSWQDGLLNFNIPLQRHICFSVWFI